MNNNNDGCEIGFGKILFWLIAIVALVLIGVFVAEFGFAGLIMGIALAALAIVLMGNIFQ